MVCQEVLRCQQLGVSSLNVKWREVLVFLSTGLGDQSSVSGRFYSVNVLDTRHDPLTSLQL